MVNKKEMVTKSIQDVTGGREAVAAMLGMSVDSFNNHLYEKKGSRFFTVDELALIASLDNTPYIAEFFAMQTGHLVVEMPNVSDLDNVELFELQLKLNGVKGLLDKTISEALVDGKIDKVERKAITEIKRQYMAVFETSMNALDAVYGENV
ncbi:YmfL family putative regulatory protein [Photobacterium sp. 1_MG-2023]|uniref:YmfL family putative regulatory protein n=1 Tax=Photobacterium sp. 1_MG-2023 TaxID=3062646 RepID=UPI0026E3EE31|nr:YmfL family putative regulatory protein [Photobacterium sp. 1_MG-2023]MDO6707957.1 YmfL family putative regulatory protein [Photobacterium sp. 1_MG-2023]